MASVFVDVQAPTINLLKDHNKEQDCVMLDVLTMHGEKISMHFMNVDELKAFVGLLEIAVNGDPTRT